MKPAVSHRTVHSSGVMAEGMFGIAMGDQVHVLTILRDRLYTNKILAVLREYSSNAWDAHRMAGRHRLPIRVHLPVALQPELIIRDWGPGISEEDIFNVYVKYGASTKRDSNTAVGMLGIGAKSAFAYSDQFTVTSWHKGLKCIYVAMLDETNVGLMTKMLEETCPEEETGIEIKIPVDPKDIYDFRREARFLFPFFDPQPEINLELETSVGDPKGSGFVRKMNEGAHLPPWVAVMGCVPYNLNFHQVRTLLEARGIKIHQVLKGGLRFNIGEVDISANREELEYTDRTKLAVVDKLANLMDELWSDLRVELDTHVTGWEKRKAVHELRQRLGLKPPKDFKRWRSKNVTLYTPKMDEETSQMVGYPLTFRMHRMTRSEGRRWKLGRTAELEVHKEACLIIRDTHKPIRGHIDPHMYMRVLTLLPHSNTTQMPTKAEVAAEIQKFLIEADLDGIPVHWLSSFQYVPVSRSGRSSKSAKHSKRTFIHVLGVADKPSDSWAISTVPVHSGDPYVLLDRFKPGGKLGRVFNEQVKKNNSILLEVFDVPPPPVFGIKTTEKRPVLHKDVDGVPYTRWFREFVEDEFKANKEARRLINVYNWSLLGGHMKTPNAQVMSRLKERLDGRHGLIRMYVTLTAALKERADWSKEKLNGIQLLIERQGKWANVRRDKARKKKLKRIPKRPVSAANIAQARILERYPLLDPDNEGPGINVFLGRRRSHWLTYINLVDNSPGKP